MERVLLPQTPPKKPYIVEAFGGENVYVPTAAATTRHLVITKDFLVCGGGGIAALVPVPFHYHNRTRHDFLCVKGQVKVWLDDQCRILSPGDYASVAPARAKGTTHSYQFLAAHTEIFGIAAPGGWENFFRALGDVYSAGPLWPDVDERDPRAELPARVARCAEEFDVVPAPGFRAVEAQAWSEERDSKLRGTGESYFMQNGKGPSAVLGGTVVRPIATGGETGGAFAMGSVEGSAAFETQVLAGGMAFPANDHAVYVSDGFLEIGVDGGAATRVGPAETVWLPAGTRFDVRVESRYVKVFVYSQPGGLIDLLYEAGKGTPHTGPNCMLPEKPEPFERRRLLDLRSQFNFELS